MQLKELFDDSSAVSPVIGVILMVAITVILAAVIGTFVLGLGGTLEETAPNTQFSFEFNGEDDSSDAVLDITHDGGDAISASQLSLSGDVDQSGESWASDELVDEPYDSNSRITAGDSIRVAHSDNAGNYQWDGDGVRSSTVRVIWTSSSGDQSSTVARWEGPDA